MGEEHSMEDEAFGMYDTTREYEEAVGVVMDWKHIHKDPKDGPEYVMRAEAEDRVADLESQLAEARTGNDHLVRQLREAQGVATTYQEQESAAIRRAEAAEVDTARLDWLVTTGASIEELINEKWECITGQDDDGNWISEVADDYREAIDAAKGEG